MWIVFCKDQFYSGGGDGHYGILKWEMTWDAPWDAEGREERDRLIEVVYKLAPGC